MKNPAFIPHKHIFYMEEKPPKKINDTQTDFKTGSLVLIDIALL